MAIRLELGDIIIDVVLKDIKNVHLSVYPPAGRVRIAAPAHMDLDTIRVFAVTKLDWIKRQQRKMQVQEREPPREFLERESHYVWGARYLLTVKEEEARPAVELEPHRLVLRVRPGFTEAQRQALIDGWYRDQLRRAAAPLIAKWEERLGVQVARCFVRRMRTKWGSCNHRRRTIRLNTDLAKKPPDCLEYIIVHELAHLIEPTHGPRFVALMDDLLPTWRLRRQALNELPVSHVDWRH